MSLSVHSCLCWHNRASWQTLCSSILCSTESQDLLFPEYKGLYFILQFTVDWLKWYLEFWAGKTDWPLVECHYNFLNYALAIPIHSFHVCRLYCIYPSIWQPSSTVFVFREIPIQNMLNFVHCYKVTPIFSDDKLEKFLVIHIGLNHTSFHVKIPLQVKHCC